LSFTFGPVAWSLLGGIPIAVPVRIVIEETTALFVAVALDRPPVLLLLLVVVPMSQEFVHPSLLVDIFALLVATVRLLLVPGPTPTFRFKVMPLILATAVDHCFRLVFPLPAALSLIIHSSELISLVRQLFLDMCLLCILIIGREWLI
jgi:hypothetical protein